MKRLASQVVPVVKNSPANAGDIRNAGSIPGSGGHGNPLQYACLENPYAQKSLEGYSPGVAKSWTQLRDLAHSHKTVSGW